ncbi:hypothetical protein, partial [Acidithiobacillus ferriphilus]|uniref:hypothetical protein n=1 Tax=Acidithiobacillus ferriphilus TaxID=1689834 RepID=UPI001C0690BA
HDAKPLRWVGMSQFYGRKVSLHYRAKTPPRHSCALTAPPERVQPCANHFRPETIQSIHVAGDGEVRKIQDTPSPKWLADFPCPAYPDVP